MTVERADVETPGPSATTLPARANIALLTLQLRDAEREAAEAEATEAGWDLDAAIADLRTRMAPLVADRRRALDDELALEHLKAAEEIEAARIDAAAIIDAARASNASTPVPDIADELFDELDEFDDIVDWDPVEPATAEMSPAAEWPPTAPTIAPIPVDAPLIPIGETPIDETPIDETPIDETSGEAAATSMVSLPAPSGSPVHIATPNTGQVVTLVIDADSLAQAVAAAFAAMFGDRPPVFPSAPPAPQIVQVTAPPAERRSFWADTWHADVLLALIALVIVVVVLIAWST